MGVRNEVVRVSVQDAGFTTGMTRLAVSAAATGRALDGVDGASVRIRQSAPGAAREVDGLTRSTRKAGPEIDRLSGRLRLFADATAALGPSVVPIAGLATVAVSGLASQLGFAVIGMGSLVAASQGVGDALKAVNEAAIEPTAANLEKARQAMSQLGPDAQAFVTRFQELRPVLGDIRDASAAGWFPGLTESLDSLERIAPQAADLFESIGTVGGSLIADGAAALAGPEWSDFRAFVLTEAPVVLEQLGRTIGNVAAGLAELWMAFAPLNRDFGDWLLDVSTGFREWSESLSGTNGFEEFVDYIRTNGPRVAEALGALGNALVQIVEAIAPLGGPSLQIIETFADAIGAIADSDLGTPIFAAVAALAVYNRTLQATLGLQRRLGLATAGAGVAGAVPGGVGLIGAGAAGRGSLRQAGADLRAYGALRTQVLARTTAETQRMNAALASAKGNLAGVAKGAAPVGIALGGMAAASAAAGESVSGTNMALGAMLGSLGGPWGAAAGTVVGSILDIKAAVETLDDILESGSQRRASSALEERQSALLNPLKNPAVIGSDLYSLATTGRTGGQRLAEQAGGWGSAGNIADGQARAKALNDQEAAEYGLSAATARTAAAINMTNAEMAASIAAIDARTGAALGAFGAETRWRDALAAATEQAKSNNAGIRGNSEEVRNNRAALEQLAGAWNTQRDAMVENGASAEAVDGKYRKARRAFIDTAAAMGVPIRQARKLADEILGIPEKRAVAVTVSGGAAAIATLRDIIREAQNVPRTIRTDYIVNRINTGALRAGGGRDGDPSTPYADGGWTGPGRKYDVAGVVHANEVVLPEDVVQRDARFLKSRYGYLPGMSDLPGYANGGAVAARSGRDMVWTTGGSGDAATRGLRALTKALAASEKALERETSKRDAVVERMNDLSSTTRDRFMSELFPETSAWSSGGTYATAMSVVRSDRAAAGSFRADVERLRGKGLTGAALDAVLTQARTPQQVADFANRSEAELAAFNRAFEQRSTAASSVGAVAADASWRRDLAARNRSRNEARREVRAMRAEVRKVTAAIERQTKASKRGAGSASRNRKRR